ncbi:MAG: hypothetical protein Q8908_14930, partial [Bacteroidota bacterium]|nr:hypothetical protein [Bacteroidota bacterium]
KRNPDSSIGQMEEIMIKDCVFLKPFPKHSEIAGYDQSHRIRVMIDNLGISGKRCTSLDDTGIDVKGFADVTVK